MFAIDWSYLGKTQSKVGIVLFRLEVIKLNSKQKSKPLNVICHYIDKPMQ